MRNFVRNGDFGLILGNYIFHFDFWNKFLNLFDFKNFNVIVMARIIIPYNFLKREKLLKDIYEKHIAEGANSALKDFDVAGTAAIMDEAREHHDSAEEKSKAAEDAYEKRDNCVQPTVKEVRHWAKFLKLKYADNPHELGNWGFVVDDSPKAKKPGKENG